MPRGRRARSRVWIYVVDGRNWQDLADLDARGFDTWAANRNTAAGDLILMYRTKPYSDIAYVFRALSNSRRSRPRRGWPWKNEIDIGDGYRLQRAITLRELKRSSQFRGWSFIQRHGQQGVMRRSRDIVAQGYWPQLRRLLISRGGSFREHLLPQPRPVFLCHASEDKRRVRSLFQRLRHAGLNPWLDEANLEPADEFDVHIEGAIRSSKAVVFCLSRSFVLNTRYVEKEIKLSLKNSRNGRRKLVPVLLESCAVPVLLNRFHHVDLRRRGAVDRLIDVLRR